MPPRSHDRAAARHAAIRATRDPRPALEPRSSGRRETAPYSDGLYRALLPLRFFVGATFLYAGVDKLVDPAFLQAAGPGSIGEQLAGFARVSPIAPLVEILALPFPVPVGVLIALAEIAVGLGALTGLLYRASAIAGASLSLLFWLTASWATRPYYYGPDLPYAFGWITLALAGHGRVYVVEGRLATWAAKQIAGARSGGPPEGHQIEQWAADPARRGFLQLMAVGIAALVIGGAAGVVGRLRPLPVAAAPGTASGRAGGTGLAPASVGPGSPPEPEPTATAAQGGPASPSGQLIAKLDELKPRQAFDFADPATGDPAVLVRLADGSVVAFDAVCTHAGCTVAYDAPSGFLICPCHGATFDPGDRARPVAGPTAVPLQALPIKLDPATGRITLTG